MSSSTAYIRGPRLGATYLGDGRCQFVVWVPSREQVELHIVAPGDRVVPMERDHRGYYTAVVEDLKPGARYGYRLDGRDERPDPASRYQPEGVHAASEIIDPEAVSWEDSEWAGLPLEEMVFYELHVGTFTREGTFDATIAHLDELRDLGVNAVEIMPVAQFPGTRNWGYDGVYPFAAQSSYGGPDGLRRFVNASHQRGMAVVLDVVYNHLGPEGNYLGQFGPYFTDFYRTPWGSALNYDGPASDEVRHYFIENALYWLTDCHVDALRLDAVHAIRDFSAQTFLQELAIAVEQRAAELGRRLYLIAESDQNDARLLLPRALNGYGLDAQWSDDFHHALHTVLTGERDGYYQDFGQIGHIATALQQAYVYTGEYSPFRRRRHGNSAAQNPARQFVICIQNHDQVGNRMLGERLGQLVDFAASKQAAAALLLAPYPPLLFMGEEYGETAPFLYFTSHGDRGLIEGVRRGREREFAAFAWRGAVPDPQAEDTFNCSRLNHALRHEGQHAVLWTFYQRLLTLRRAIPALAHLSKEHIEAVAFEDARALFVRRWCEGDEVFAVFGFGDQDAVLPLPIPAGTWEKQLDSLEEQWRGGGSTLPQTIEMQEGTMLTLQPGACVLYRRRP